MRTFRWLAILAILTCMLGGAFAPTQAAPQRATAGDLRALLDTQLGEHVLLAAAATNAALHGRDAEFKAAADALDANSVELSKSIGSVYGTDAENAFLPLWRKHIGFFVDYTTGVATKDQTKKDQAVKDLGQYSQDFGAFINGANPNIPKQAVVDLLGPHAMTLASVVDAQAVDDYPTAYANLRKAYSHMDMIAAALAGGIGKQFPDKFSGDANDGAGQLRSTLTQQLNEHVALASFTTNAALHGRDAEFKAAAAALDGNSVDLSKSIGSVYGTDAENAFLPLWRKHIGFFVDYTTGVATKDQAKQDQAVKDLGQYAQDFGAFVSGANPNIPKQAVVDLLGPHAMTLAATVNAQGADDFPTAYAKQREAYAHMPMIANALTDGIIKQFPAKFGGTTSAPADQAPAATPMPHDMPNSMPNTGSNSFPWTGLVAAAAVVALVSGLILRKRVGATQR